MPETRTDGGARIGGERFEELSLKLPMRVTLLILAVRFTRKTIIQSLLYYYLGNPLSLLVLINRMDPRKVDLRGGGRGHTKK